MHRLPLAATLAALLASPLAAQPRPIPAAVGDGPFDPPAVLAPQAGAAIYVPPASVVAARYVALDGEEPFDTSAIGGSKTAFVFLTRGLPAGKTYRFVGIGSNEKGDLTRKDFAVTIPGPPAPPAPPAPVPPGPAPPAPVNPYRAQLRAAFDADGGDAAAKADVRAKLAELYSLGATMAADPAVTTTDVLRERLRRAGSTLAGDQLVGTRTAIAGLVSPVLPLGQTLDPGRRRTAADLFRQISDALGW